MTLLDFVCVGSLEKERSTLAMLGCVVWVSQSSRITVAHTHACVVYMYAYVYWEVYR